MTSNRPLAATRFEPERMFRPRSLAIIGGEGRIARQLLANVTEAGFEGAVQIVPADGQPQPADLAVFTGENETLAPWLPKLVEAGIYAGVCLGMTPDVEACLGYGVKVLGAGSFGIACPEIKLNATLSHLQPKPGRVALVSQSAALCRAVLDWAEPNGIGFSQVVGIGGNAGVGFNQVVDFLARDSSTGPILLDIRRLRTPRRFLSAARAAARLRPVIALRAGSRLLDASGRAEMVFDAALNRAGVLTVTRMEDLLAALETLTRAPPLNGDTLAIVTNAIGPGRMAADAALSSGIALTELAAETREVMHLRFPGVDTASIIYVGVQEPIRLAEAAALLSGAREVGGVLVVMAPTGPEDAAGVEALAAVASAKGALPHRPLLVCAMGETTGAPHRRRLAEAGLPVFASPEQAVGGFRHLLRVRRARAAARELPTSDVLDLAPDRPAVRRIIERARADERSDLTGDESLAVLAAYGLSWNRPPLEISVADDELFGPVIGAGSGRADEMAYDLPPLNLSLAAGMVKHTPAARDLLPAQGKALADALVRTSQLVVDVPELATLRFGPAGDPAATLRPPGELGQLSIAPYPANLVEEWQSGGETITIRPIRPEDAAAHAALFSRLTPEDIRFRFFSAMRLLSPERIARMTQVDYDREMAFVAVRGEGETVGVSRLVCERDTGEFAVLVQPDMRGRGLAQRLMVRVIDWARSQGMSAVVGQVLADNNHMLGFMRRLGFTLHRLPDEADVVEARYQLRDAAAHQSDV